MPVPIIVLLGNENDSFTELSSAAKARCDMALALLASDPTMKLTCTGAFGYHFNRTDAPHSAYLTRYMSQKGMDPQRVLFCAHSCGTLEDALLVRKSLYDLDVLVPGLQVHVITNAYHIPRVKFIFGRILPECNLVFREAADPDPDDLPSMRDEEKRFARLRRDWVTVPLYCGQKFPQLIYQNAQEEHKHYDNLSVLAITGVLAATAIPFALSDKLTRLNLEHPSFFVAAVIVVLLTVVYDQMASFASSARNVMRFVEMSFGCRGFSCNCKDIRIFTLDLRMRWLMEIISFLLAVMLLTLGFVL